MSDNVSLGEVFSSIFVSPAEAAHLLQAWAREHSGGAQTELSGKLNDAATAVVQPKPEVESQTEVVEVTT